MGRGLAGVTSMHREHARMRNAPPDEAMAAFLEAFRDDLSDRPVVVGRLFAALAANLQGLPRPRADLLLTALDSAITVIRPESPTERYSVSGLI